MNTVYVSISLPHRSEHYNPTDLDLQLSWAGSTGPGTGFGFCLWFEAEKSRWDMVTGILEDRKSTRLNSSHRL